VTPGHKILAPMPKSREPQDLFDAARRVMASLAG
jgi:hypothetical protein